MASFWNQNPQVPDGAFSVDLSLLLFLAGYYTNKLYYVLYNHQPLHSSVAIAERKHNDLRTR